MIGRGRTPRPDSSRRPDRTPPLLGAAVLCMLRMGWPQADSAVLGFSTMATPALRQRDQSSLLRHPLIVDTGVNVPLRPNPPPHKHTSHAPEFPVWASWAHFYVSMYFRVVVLSFCFGTAVIQRSLVNEITCRSCFLPRYRAEVHEAPSSGCSLVPLHLFLSQPFVACLLRGENIPSRIGTKGLGLFVHTDTDTDTHTRTHSFVQKLRCLGSRIGRVV
jgi:hypothetical protein